MNRYYFRNLFKKLTNKNMLIFIDQGFVSISNFVIGIILARILGVEDFGVYGLLWIIIMYINIIQNALIISPMMTIGPKFYGEEQKRYFCGVFVQQVFFNFLISFFIIVVGMIFLKILFDNSFDITIILSLSLSSFFYQISDFMRRYFYTIKNTILPLCLDCCSYLIQITILMLIQKLNINIEVYQVFLIFTLSLIVSNLIGIPFLKIIKLTVNELVEVIKRNFKLSKWLLVTNSCQYIGTQGVIGLSGVILEPSSVGGIRANLNIIAPINLFMQAFQNYLPIKATEVYLNNSKKGLKKFLFKIIFILVIFFSLLIFTAFFYGEKIIIGIYGQDYIEFTYLLPYLFVYSILSSIIIIISIYYRTIEDTRPLALTSIYASLFSVTIGLILMIYFGELGVVLGLISFNLIILLILSANIIYNNFKVEKI